LALQNGLTHYPQVRETHLFFRGDVDLPERIILLDGSGSVSFDVLSWLNEQNVSLIRIDWKGEIVCVAGASRYSANPFRVQWQIETRDNPDRRMEFSRSIIARKIEASIITLEKSIRRSENGSRQYRPPMRPSLASMIIHRRQVPNCADWKPIARRRILQLARNTDQMARHKSPPNSRKLEVDRSAHVAVPFGGQP
jgi:hypothetical protein